MPISRLAPDEGNEKGEDEEENEGEDDGNET